MDFDEIFAKLKKRKQFLGMTYRELGAESGYNWSAIGKWLNGKHNIHLRQLLDLAKTLGLKIELELDDD